MEEFISDTLTQIIKGVKKADDEAKALGGGGRVNPAVMPIPDNKNRLPLSGNLYRSAELIEFDIALTISNETTEGQSRHCSYRLDWGRGVFNKHISEPRQIQGSDCIAARATRH